MGRYFSGLSLSLVLWALFVSVGQAQESKERVLCFGDSITQGTYVGGRYVTGKSWVDMLQKRSGGTLECINAGRSGRQTIQKREILPYLKRYKDVDHVMFYLGVNDLHESTDAANARNLKGCVTNTKWLIDKVREAYGNDVKVTILSTCGLDVAHVIPRFKNIGFTARSQKMLVQLAPLYRELAKAEGCHFIDLWGVVSTQNYSDGLHPNLVGQQQTVEYMWNSLVNDGGPIKVACVGDSITYGSTIRNRARDSYPAQLQKMLGAKYLVKNFGVSGRTCLQKGDFPYRREQAYKESLKFAPNHVYIQLGTNDSKPHNWKFKAEYKTDLRALAQSFLDLPTKPQVTLAFPAPVQHDRWGITHNVVFNEVIPIIKELAAEMKLDTIDFNSAIPNERGLFNDGIHPNPRGAWYMSAAIYKDLRGRRNESGLTLPAAFGDHMVLQRGKEVPVWGWGNAGDKVKVFINGKSAEAVTDASGKWMVKLPAMKAGGPYSMQIQGPKGRMMLNDILVGEVWICSGQSNMEMALKGRRWGSEVVGSKEAIATANLPKLRLFHLQRQMAVTPQKDCVGSWRRCTPEAVPNFSAVGYFFGRKLVKDLKDVPVGLVMTSWGGTPSQAWTDAKTLSQFKSFKPEVDFIKSVAENPTRFQNGYGKKLKLWRSELIRHFTNGKKLTTVDRSLWKEATLPKKWSQTTDLQHAVGAVCYQKSVTIPESWKNKKLIVELGSIDDMDVTFFNDRQIGSLNRWNAKRAYRVNGKLVNGDSAVISVIVINASGDGGFSGKATGLKIYPAGKKAESISLSGAWKQSQLLKKQELLRQPSKPGRVYCQRSTVLFNGMINPLLPMAIRGAIWYQGESNADNASQYLQIFPAMVKNWRQCFGQGNFPFYYVQIAPFRYRANRDGVGIREVQRQSLKLIPNSGMACIMDKTTLRSIHPPYKTEVGERLALWALSKDYGFKVQCSGPLYKGFKIERNKIRVSFDHAESGLWSKGKEIRNFEVAGDGGKYYPAKAVIDGSTMVVYSNKVKAPKHVRYGWHNQAVAEFWNKEGLPASSFRSHELPKALIVGDSISLGYTPFVVKALKDKVKVVHHHGNAGPTMRGMQLLDQWIGDTKWDVIHFNWGLWDMYGWYYENDDRSPEAYAKRLDILVTRLEQTGAKLIWGTTTPGCPGSEAHCQLTLNKETEQKYLDAAVRVMKKHGIVIDDLNGFMSPQRKKYAIDDHNVHYTKSGYEALAREVSKAILAQLSK